MERKGTGKEEPRVIGCVKSARYIRMHVCMYVCSSTVTFREHESKLFPSSDRAKVHMRYGYFTLLFINYIFLHR